MTKFKRPIEDVLASGYNKGLVCSQLKALFEYKHEQDMYIDQAKVFKLWFESSTNVGDRPRFINVKDVFKLDKDVLIIVSSASSMVYKQVNFSVYTINHGKWVFFGVPIAKAVEKALAGQATVSRIIIDRGLVS